MNKLDNLFSKKLSEHSTRPSERANELFLSRLAKKKKVVFWTPIKRNFAAAASLVLLGGLGYYSIQDNGQKVQVAQSQVNSNSIAEVPQESFSPKVQNRTEVNEQLNKYTKKGFANDAYLGIAGGSETPRLLVNAKTSPANVEYSNKLSSLSQDESIEYLQPQVAVSVTRPDTRALEQVTDAVLDDFKTDDDTFIIVSPLDTYASNDVWEIPSILDQPSMDNALVLEDHQERLLTKIYDEVKHLKKGQHLDLSKFGFKSLEEMALSEEGFIVTETKKIRSKLQWLKAKIYN